MTGESKVDPNPRTELTCGPEGPSSPSLPEGPTGPGTPPSPKQTKFKVSCEDMYDNRKHSPFLQF